MTDSPYDPNPEDVEYREYEFEWEGTKMDSMPPVFADARFDYEDGGWVLTDIDCWFDKEDSAINGELQHLYMYVANDPFPKPATLTTLLDVVKAYCKQKFDNE